MKASLNLADFCDMTELEKILSDWSVTSRMAVIAKDVNRHNITKQYGQSDYCRYLMTAEGANGICLNYLDKANVFCCVGGVCGFSLPVTLPNGQIIAYVFCGQVKFPDGKVPDFEKLAAAFKLDVEALRADYDKLFVKTKEEIEAAKALLSSAVNSFVAKNYEKWLNENESQDDRILSQITQILYAYNITLNLNTGQYTLITGTGLERLVTKYRKGTDYETAQKEALRYVHPSYTERLSQLLDLDNLRKNEKRNGHIDTIEYPVLYPNAEGCEWHEVNVFASHDNQGMPIINILGRDVTEAHNLQEKNNREIRAAAAKDQILSEITKSLYSYNFTVNLETGKFSLITGTGMEDIVSDFCTFDTFSQVNEYAIKFIQPDYLDSYKELMLLENLRKKSSMNGHIGQMEYAVNGKNGTEWHEINVFIGTDENGVPIANILGRDITEAHDRADTKAQLEIAKASNRSKTQFLFNMSHDIRTPMNAIIGFTDLLQKHLDDHEMAESYIAKIKYSNDFLLSLINNVLEMARIESGKETLDESVCNVHEFNDSLEAIFATQMREKNINFSVNSYVEHPYMIGDPTKSKEIFLNVLSNALKYTPAGGTVTFETTEEPSEIAGYAYYKTVVTDTGIGMSKEFLPHIFDEFARERNSTESKVIGTGLGMSIVKSLVELMHGTIEVESELGKGTTFTIIIPHRYTEKEAHEVETVQHVSAEDVSFEGKRILLAEDNELNAEIAITILEEVGFKVEHAEDGVACISMLEQAEAGYYDLILMDIQMPNLNGFEATQRIRAFEDTAKANIPILAMTANAFDEDKRNALNAGMNGHLAKPIDINVLMEELARVLR